MIPPRLTLSNIRYVSRVKWSNPGKRVAPSPTSRCSCYWKGSLRVALDYGRQLYWLTISLYIPYLAFFSCSTSVQFIRILTCIFSFTSLHFLSSDKKMVINCSLLLHLVSRVSLWTQKWIMNKLIIFQTIGSFFIINYVDLVWFVWFYGISTFVGYFTPNPCLCK